jgi:hypothetical protein
MLSVQDGPNTFSATRHIPVILHKYDETINGHEYHIEVSSVGAGQWRANIRRTPGGSAALMPFYGKTPDEAAGQLSKWLSIAHGQPTSRL